MTSRPTDGLACPARIYQIGVGGVNHQVRIISPSHFLQNEHTQTFSILFSSARDVSSSLPRLVRTKSHHLTSVLHDTLLRVKCSVKNWCP